MADSNGLPVTFAGSARRNIYRQARDSRGWLHCYSLIRDTQGRFWAWSYKPIGPGARIGTARDFVLVRARWLRKRRMAKAVCERRLARQS